MWSLKDIIFLNSFIATQKVGATGMLLRSLKRAFWKQFVLLKNNYKIRKRTQVSRPPKPFRVDIINAWPQKWSICFLIFLTNFFVGRVFLTLLFCACSTFFFIIFVNEILKLKSSLEACVLLRAVSKLMARVLFYKLFRTSENKSTE